MESKFTFKQTKPKMKGRNLNERFNRENNTVLNLSKMIGISNPKIPVFIESERASMALGVDSTHSTVLKYIERCLGFQSIS